MGDEADTSVLDLSTTHLRNQVLDAIMAEDSDTATRWINADTAIIIDADEHQGSLMFSPPARAGESSAAADQSFNLGTLDPDLAAVLSRNRLPNSTANVKHDDCIFATQRSSSPAGDRSLATVAYLSAIHTLSIEFKRWVHRITLVPDVTTWQCIIVRLC